MKIGSLFSGYEGLTAAVQAVFGGDVAWVSDIDPGANKILAHHWPEVPNLGDITTVDWSQVEPVDIVCGGFPCTDVSMAGRRAGLHGGTRSGLFANMMHAVATLRPSLVVIENVRGLLTARGDEPTDELVAAWVQRDRWLRVLTLINSKLQKALREGKRKYVQWYRRDQHRILGRFKRAVGAAKRADARIVRAIGTVLGSLADIGFDAEWCGLRAADVGAPHGRFRVFIIAWPADSDGAGLEERVSVGRDTGPECAPVGGSDPALVILPTPTARLGDGTSRGASHPARRKASGRDGGDNLRTAITLLPTPRSAADRTSINAATRADSMSSPSLGQAVELAQGSIPREFTDDEMPAGWAKLLPTPTAVPYGNNQSASAGAAVRPSLDTLAPQLLPTPRASDGTKGGPNQRGSSGDLMLPSDVQRLLPTPIACDGGGGPKRIRESDGQTEAGHGAQVRDLAPTLYGSWGVFEPAIRRWETILGRPAPGPTELAPKGGQRLSPGFVEWMQGLPAGHVTDPAIGLTRNEQLKALGNGVVVQQAEAALRYLMERAGS